MATQPARECESHSDSTLGDVLETDSGRRPLWGILVLLGFIAFSIFAVWRVTAGNDSGTPNYSSTVTTTVPLDSGSTEPISSKPDRDSAGATAFFFASVVAIVLVGGRIVWRARQIYRTSSRRQASG